MIDLYTSSTPNGHKASVTLEELELPYEVHAISLSDGDQKTAEFLAMNPNGRIPVIVDREADNFVVFETGAIMVYLAEKTGRLLPTDVKVRSVVMQWLMFQMGGVGPFFGQANHFNRYAPEQVPYAIERYNTEAARLLRVMDKQLDGQDWIAGDYSIADMALFGWTRDYAKDVKILAPYGNVADWFARLLARPAVERGLAVLAETRKAPSEFDDKARAVMFGEGVDETIKRSET